MDIATEWTTNANEALTITLDDSSAHQGKGKGKESSSATSSFQPIFTYPIYGDAETILGYKDLAIELKMDATTMLPLVTMQSSDKLDLAGVTFDDPVQKLLEFLPEGTATNEEQWEAQREAESGTKPPGTEFAQLTAQGQTYTVYRSTLQDPATLQLHLRLQVFVPLFIEAGSYIDAEDDRWEIYVVYGPDGRVVGFSTVYCYWFYEPSATEPPAPADASLADLQAQPFAPTLRKRISQYVVLPPYQGQGLGGALYQQLFARFYEDKNVYEITVEDPSEAFDDLRDRCDLKWLSDVGFTSKVFRLLQTTSAHGESEGDNKTGRTRVVAGPFWAKWLEKNRLQYKLASRQFARCFEMVLLACAQVSSPAKKRLIKDARLFVKRRVYVRNREFLEDLGGKTEIMSKLQETYESMDDDYTRIMKPVLGYVKDSLKKRPRDDENGEAVKKVRVE